MNQTRDLIVAILVLNFSAGQIFSQEDKPAANAGGKPAAKEKGAKPNLDPSALKEFEEKAKAQMAERIVKEAQERAQLKPAVPPQIMVIVEMIEVEHDDFSEYIQENPLTTDASDLRGVVQGWVKAKKAKIRQTLVVAARSGQRAKAEGITEVIYPTEFDPSNIPTTVTLDGDSQAPVTPPNPTAFETRNTGTTLEVDPVLGQDGTTIDLNLSPEWVVHVEDKLQETEYDDKLQTVSQPTFHTTKMTMQVSVTSGGYVFMGTARMADKEKTKTIEDSLLLMFVRADAL